MGSTQKVLSFDSAIRIATLYVLLVKALEPTSVPCTKFSEDFTAIPAQGRSDRGETGARPPAFSLLDCLGCDGEIRLSLARISWVAVYLLCCYRASASLRSVSLH